MLAHRFNLGTAGDLLLENEHTLFTRYTLSLPSDFLGPNLVSLKMTLLDG